MVWHDANRVPLSTQSDSPARWRRCTFRRASSPASPRPSAPPTRHPVKVAAGSPALLPAADLKARIYSAKLRRGIGAMQRARRLPPSLLGLHRRRSPHFSAASALRRPTHAPLRACPPPITHTPATLTTYVGPSL